MRLSRICQRVTGILRTGALLCFLLAFNSPRLAALSVLATLAHEGGHAAVFLFCGGVGRMRHRAFGFCMTGTRLLSYREEAAVCAAGPLVNLCLAALCLVLLPFGKEFFAAFATVNLISAGCNLLPLPGYDGARLLTLALARRDREAEAETVITFLGLGVSAALVFLSLYVMAVSDSAYWIFLSFFSSFLSCVIGAVSRIKSENSRDFKSKNEENRGFQ